MNLTATGDATYNTYLIIIHDNIACRWFNICPLPNWINIVTISSPHPYMIFLWGWFTNSVQQCTVSALIMLPIWRQWLSEWWGMLIFSARLTDNVHFWNISGSLCSLNIQHFSGDQPHCPKSRTFGTNTQLSHTGQRSTLVISKRCSLTICPRRTYSDHEHDFFSSFNIDPLLKTSLPNINSSTDDMKHPFLLQAACKWACVVLKLHKEH